MVLPTKPDYLRNDEDLVWSFLVFASTGSPIDSGMMIALPQPRAWRDLCNRARKYVATHPSKLWAGAPSNFTAKLAGDLPVYGRFFGDEEKITVPAQIWNELVDLARSRFSWKWHAFPFARGRRVSSEESALRGRIESRACLGITFGTDDFRGQPEMVTGAVALLAYHDSPPPRAAQIQAALLAGRAVSVARLTAAVNSLVTDR